MVEISMSGSGEGLVCVTGRGYSTIAVCHTSVGMRGNICIVPSAEEGRWECPNTSASQGEGPAPRLPMRPQGKFAHQECKGQDAKESPKKSSGSSIFSVAYSKDLSKKLQVD